MSQEIVILEGENIVNKLASSFPEQEQKEIAREMFLAMNMKSTGTWENKVKYNAYQALSYVMACKELKLNSVLNHVIMLEDQFYITLQGHLQNAHATGQLVGLKTDIISGDTLEVEVTEWNNKVPSKVKKTVKQFRYRCTIQKKIGESVAEYSAEWVADQTNVTGGSKKSELMIEQMAEARAMRRCLSRAFPVGLGNYEDVQEAQEYERHSPAAEVTENAKSSAKSAAASIKRKAEPVSEQTAPAPEVKPEPEQAPTPVEEPMPEAIAVREEIAATPPGLDQLKRILELAAELGIETPKPTTRDEARAIISELVEKKNSLEAAMAATPATEMPASYNEVQEMAAVFTEEPAEEPTLEELNAELEVAREKFSKALNAHQKDPTPENEAAKTQCATEVVRINRLILAKNGG